VRSSSLEFYELAQWVAVPEWSDGGLVPIKQTFVGLLDVLVGSPRLRAVTNVSSVLRWEHWPLAESHQIVVVLSLSIISSLTV